MNLPKLVAFAGYAGAGKDAAAQCLLDRGYRRHNFGDIIKAQVDPIVRQHFGFSAFTEDRQQKEWIRRTLEAWGEDNYEAICEEFFETLPEYAVNTRLVRCVEAERWKRRGGVIVMIHRDDTKAATDWEADRLVELVEAGHIDGYISNHDSLAELYRNTLATLEALANAKA